MALCAFIMYFVALIFDLPDWPCSLRLVSLLLFQSTNLHLPTEDCRHIILSFYSSSVTTLPLPSSRIDVSITIKAGNNLDFGSENLYMRVQIRGIRPEILLPFTKISENVARPERVGEQGSDVADGAQPAKVVQKFKRSLHQEIPSVTLDFIHQELTALKRPSSI